MISMSYFLGIFGAALLLGLVIELLRRRRLRERHAFWWLLLGLLILVVAIFPRLLDAAANLLGVELPINLVFFVGIIALFLVSVQQSSELTKLEEKNRVLAENQALLEIRVRELEQQRLS